MIDEMQLSFEQVYADFQPRVLRCLTRMIGEHEAEDLTQEVFIKISRSLDTFRGESQLSTWIYRIATNAALDRLRNPAFKRVAPDAPPVGDESGEVDEDGEIEIDAPSLDQQVCRKERYECYRDFVEKLPANYRLVIALSEWEELTAKEIADILGLSLDVVKIRLHRGRELLLKTLREHCKPEDWL